MEMTENISHLGLLRYESRPTASFCTFKTSVWYFPVLSVNKKLVYVMYIFNVV